MGYLKPWVSCPSKVTNGADDIWATKKNPLYWLVNKVPFKWLIKKSPRNWVGLHPLYTLNSKAFFSLLLWLRTPTSSPVPSKSFVPVLGFPHICATKWKRGNMSGASAFGEVEGEQKLSGWVLANKKHMWIPGRQRINVCHTCTHLGIILLVHVCRCTIHGFYGVRFFWSQGLWLVFAQFHLQENHESEMNKMNALEANNPSTPRFTWLIMQRSAGYMSWVFLKVWRISWHQEGNAAKSDTEFCVGRNWMAARRSPLHPGDTAKSAKLRERSRCCRRWWVHVHGKLHGLVKCLVSLKQLAYAPFGVVHFQHRADLSEARRKLRQLQFLFLQFVPWTPRSSDLCSTALAVGPSCCYRLAYRFGLASPWKRRNNFSQWDKVLISTRNKGNG